MIRRISLILTMVGMLLLSTTLIAAEPDGSTVQQYRTELDEYKQAVGAKAADKDIEMVEKWLDEAEVLLANGDDGAAKRRLKRVEFGLDLVRAILAAEQVRNAAEEQEATAYTAPDTTEKLRADIEKLQQQKEELQSELKRLQQ